MFVRCRICRIHFPTHQRHLTSVISVDLEARTKTFLIFKFVAHANGHSNGEQSLLRLELRYSSEKLSTSNLSYLSGWYALCLFSSSSSWYFDFLFWFGFIQHSPLALVTRALEMQIFPSVVTRRMICQEAFQPTDNVIYCQSFCATTNAVAMAWVDDGPRNNIYREIKFIFEMFCVPVP